MRLRVTSPAAKELAAAVDYILERNPQAAYSFGDTISRAFNDLLLFPRAGQRTETAGVRAKTVSGFPYRIFYELDGDTVVVLSIFHTAQDPGKGY